MTTTLLVNGIGGLLILFIIAWFWLIKPRGKKLSTDKPIRIIVENGVYTPAVIETPANQSMTLTFIRKDATPCSSVVVFDDLDITQELPAETPLNIVLPPLKPGRYPFACQMKMYQGEIIVKSSN